MPKSVLQPNVPSRMLYASLTNMKSKAIQSLQKRNCKSSLSKINGKAERGLILKSGEHVYVYALPPQVHKESFPHFKWKIVKYTAFNLEGTFLCLGIISSDLLQYIRKVRKKGGILLALLSALWVF